MNTNYLFNLLSKIKIKKKQINKNYSPKKTK